MTETVRGKRILVVEDEMMLVMMLEDILEGLGCAVTTVARLARAITIAETDSFDGAFLDVNVAGEAVYPVAAILTRRNIPFVFSTGYEKDSVPPEYRDRPVLPKPYLPAKVEQAVASFGK